MALADYFQRSAVAASHALGKFDRDRFAESLSAFAVGVSIGEKGCASPEGRSLAEFSTRLLARLYPRLCIQAADASVAGELRGLARAINPAIDLEEEAEIGVLVGEGAVPFTKNVFTGSDGWEGLVGTASEHATGDSVNPFGPAVAACVGAANVFRAQFLPDADLDGEVRFSAWSAVAGPVNGKAPRIDAVAIPTSVALVGLGAIGNAAAWTLSRLPVDGTIDLVDPEIIDLGNLQRYMLSSRADVGRSKVDVAGEYFEGTTRARLHPVEWAEFVVGGLYKIDAVAVAVDAANSRIGIQSCLPRIVSNAWTQPGDLGVSVHGDFGGHGACLACLYLPEGPGPNEDEMVAAALGVPDLVLDIRRLLDDGKPVPATVLDSIAKRLNVPRESLEPFEARPLRELYVEGVCGGTIVPLGTGDSPREMHVPLPHQSALAGVLLGATLCLPSTKDHQETRSIKIDLLRPWPSGLEPQPLAADSSGRCICRDADYVTAHRTKWR